VDIAEAHRQYQIAVETRRTAVEQLRETLSMEDELQAVVDDETDALRQAELAWLNAAL
jgi:hypothetical protein